MQCDSSGDVCSKNNRWVEGVGGIATRITSQSFLVCNGDGLADRRDQTRATVDCDICGICFIL